MQGGKQYIHYPALDLAKRTAVNIRVAAGTKHPQQAIVSARQYPARHQAVEQAIGNALDGVVSLCNDVAQWSVRPDAVYEEFRNAGHGIDKPSDIASLSLEDIDMVVGCLAAKYIRRRFTGYSPCPQFVSYLYRT